MAAYVSVPEDVESPRPSDGIMYGRRQPLSQKKSKKPTESRLNEKLLAVLRRHDDTFGHTDPYFIAPPTRNMTFELESYTHISRVTRSSTSTATSVAAMARENARRKLHESQSLSWSMSYHADRSSTDADAESFLEGLTYGYEHEEMAAVAVTPSTFAELGVGDQKAGREHDDDDGEFEDDERYDARGDTDTWGCIESLGDTVLLPEGFGLENFAAMQNSTSGDQSLSNDNDASGSGSVGCDT